MNSSLWFELLFLQGQDTSGTYRRLTLGVKDISGVQLTGNTCMALFMDARTWPLVLEGYI